MHIRKATITDSESIALLFMMVMDDMVYRFIGESDYQKGLNFFEKFIRENNNQYSFQNCYVAIFNDEVVGVINVYDGALLGELRQPILNYIHQNTNPEFYIEDETQACEFYIDVIAVKQDAQGKGIGSKLLEYAIRIFCIEQHHTLGLLVDKKNPNAKNLYLRSGFKKVGETTLSNHHMEHLQLEI